MKVPKMSVGEYGNVDRGCFLCHNITFKFSFGRHFILRVKIHVIVE